MKTNYRKRCNEQIILLKNVIKNLQEIHYYWNMDEDIAKVYEKGGFWHDDYYNIMKDIEEWAEYRIKDFKYDIVVKEIKMGYTADEYRIYLKVKHALLYEDAKIFVTDYLAEEMECNPWDIEDEQLNKYDYDYLVNEFEEKEEMTSDFNDAWKSIVENYMENFEDDKNEED